MSQLWLKNIWKLHKKVIFVVVIKETRITRTKTLPAQIWKQRTLAWDDSWSWPSSVRRWLYSCGQGLTCEFEKWAIMSFSLLTLFQFLHSSSTDFFSWAPLSLGPGCSLIRSTRTFGTKVCSYDKNTESSFYNVLSSLGATEIRGVRFTHAKVRKKIRKLRASAATVPKWDGTRVSQELENEILWASVGG